MARVVPAWDGAMSRIVACCDLWEARRAAGLTVEQVRALLGDPERRISDWPAATISSLAKQLRTAPADVRGWRPPFTRRAG